MYRKETSGGLQPDGQLLGVLDYGGGYFGDVNVPAGHASHWMEQFTKLTKAYLRAEN